MIILIASCSRPEASFSYNCSTCETGDPVQFLNSSVNSNTFNWDFGDENTSTEENPVHIYNVSGVYDVRLTISNNYGSDAANSLVTIKEPAGVLIERIVYSPGLDGNLLGDLSSRNVSIYLPPGYESSEKRFPVIYLLHGWIGHNILWFGGGGYAEVNLEPIMNDLINNKTIEPMILVSPDSYNYFLGSWYINSVSSGNWEDFIVKDVVQFIDLNYRTIANSGSRGIAGHSMGGYGTMMIAMKHPDIFSAAYGLSSSYLVLDPNPDSYLDYNRSLFKEISKAKNLGDFAFLSLDAKLMLSISVAMVPNPSKPPFYCDYIINSNGDFVSSVWQRIMAFDPYTSISTYRQNILQLAAIRLDCGDRDDNRYSNICFANKLSDIGIENVFESFSGGHSDKLEERMKLKVLPFFSKNLKHEGKD
jgi:S-formylglutathione hydrolase